MSNTSDVTVSTAADKLKLGIAITLAVAAIGVFYLLGKQELWLRVTSLLGLMLVSAALFFISTPGQQLISFGRESARETRKVVWPTRKEAGQMTIYVFVFVVVMSLFLWVTDKSVEWVLYDLILGWKR